MLRSSTSYQKQNTLAALYGFTLVEISIVLVIIGLIVGGILVGTTLINTARTVASISQLEEYKIATNLFKIKTGFLPGDIAEPNATQLGLHHRANCAGYGNDDGQLQGLGNVNAGCSNGTNAQNTAGVNGESLLFWQDLARMGLIKAKVQNYNNTNWNICLSCSTIDQCFERSKVGDENYTTVWSGGYRAYAYYNSDRKNYFSIVRITKLSDCNGSVGTGLSVSQAYYIDSKIDDGLPQSGRTIAMLPYSYTAAWAAGNGNMGASGTRCCYGAADYNAPVTTATPYYTTNCYDNNNVAGPQQYSMRLNSERINCAISTRID